MQARPPSHAGQAKMESGHTPAWAAEAALAAPVESLGGAPTPSMKCRPGSMILDIKVMVCLKWFAVEGVHVM